MPRGAASQQDPACARTACRRRRRRESDGADSSPSSIRAVGRDGLFVSTDIGRRPPIHVSASTMPSYGVVCTSSLESYSARNRSSAPGVSGSSDAAVRARRTSSGAPSPTMSTTAAVGWGMPPSSSRSAWAASAISTLESTSVPSRSNTTSPMLSRSAGIGLFCVPHAREGYHLSLMGAALTAALRTVLGRPRCASGLRES